ncbi:DUF4198 domain-containing protein [Silicimonas sp. MF1-12-2]|uniref:DUF4198 domain-containing protein n=1 Tax=Silicimonas sp. MF1-12-2 TaxID=3384793 RepID=UPI0039B4C7CC
MLRSLVLSLPLACFALSAKGHEFWIDPLEHQVATGGTVSADIRVGQTYKGSSYSFLPPNFRRFDYALGDQLAEVPGTIGDRPAVNMEAPGEGLLILIHETTDLVVNYTEYDRFKSFVEHKAAAWVLDEHAARGFPTDKFREVYSRYAKSLIGIGNSEGADRAVGLLTEIVALENPYTGDMSDGIDVQVLYNGAPRASEQIEIFEKAADESVEVSTVTTDAEGRATIPVRPGYRYMLDSVVLREPEPDLAAAKDAIWESLWANLTFAVPE